MEYSKRVLTNSPIGTALVKKEGGFIYGNAALSQILGYSHEELLTINWQSITHPDDLKADTNLVAEMLSGVRDSYQLQKRYIRKDGSICNAVLSVSKVLNNEGNFECFLSQINDSIAHIEDLELKHFHIEVLDAIATNQFVLHYQEIRHLQSNQVVGYEALVRWHHPVKGLIYPNDFIERCEANPDVMLQLCQWVFRQACRDRHKLTGFISINVSPKSLLHLSFVEMASDHSVIADKPVIFLEITERVLASLEGTEVLADLESKGFGFFADDFGQANTGLIQVIQIIKALDHDSAIKIKIDIWFTKHLEDPITYVSIKVLIDLFHGLGIEIIAEGIETESQLKAWQELGCDYGQGWLWGRAKAL